MSKEQIPVEQVVRACFEAYSKRDRKAIESLIADDFRFTSPLDNQIDRNAYFETCWPGSESLVVMTLQHLAVFDGDKAYVTYEALRRDGQRFRNTELHTVKGGQLSQVEVYFGWNIPHEVPAGTHRAAETPAA
ncbi:MAG TPA: nuclear transport factor 2 family protein [Rhizobacter sp.]|nr:nuclear transport factor 2 family protein [Rhizobacter sp.]